MRKLILLLFVGLSLTVTAQVVRAATLTLDKIGTSSTAGQVFTQWTYTGANPRFEGTADPSAVVSVRIADQTFTSTADTTGSWTYTPTTLDESGNYPIVLTSAEDIISFNLTIDLDATSTSTASATTTGSTDTKGGIDYPETLPQTGTMTTMALLIVGGATFIIAGVFLYWKLIPQLVFESASETEEQ